MDFKSIIFDFELFDAKNFSSFNYLQLDNTFIGIYFGFNRLTFIHTSFHGDIRYSDISFENILNFIAPEHKKRALQFIFNYICQKGMLNTNFKASSKPNVDMSTCIINPNAEWIEVKLTNVYSVINDYFFEQRLDLDLHTYDQFKQKCIQRIKLYKQETTDNDAEEIQRSLNQKIVENIIVPISVIEEFETIKNIDQL
jgi:hypothetical protein